MAGGLDIVRAYRPGPPLRCRGARALRRARSRPLYSPERREVSHYRSGAGAERTRILRGRPARVVGEAVETSPGGTHGESRRVVPAAARLSRPLAGQIRSVDPSGVAPGRRAVPTVRPARTADPGRPLKVRTVVRRAGGAVFRSARGHGYRPDLPRPQAAAEAGRGFHGGRSEHAPPGVEHERQHRGKRNALLGQIEVKPPILDGTLCEGQQAHVPTEPR